MTLYDWASDDDDCQKRSDGGLTQLQQPTSVVRCLAVVTHLQILIKHR